MNHIYNKRACFILPFLILTFSRCNKLTQVPEPVNTITTKETFNNDATATSAITGMYFDLVWGKGGLAYSNGYITIAAGMSADELHIFNGPSPYETNELNATTIDGTFWNGPYFDIYLANAALEALPGSAGVSNTVKNQLIGEASFFRAFCHFYLVNLFGDVPYVTTTAYTVNDTIHRAPVSQVYSQIIVDLKQSQSLLLNDYAVSGGQRTRVNRFAATALLARAYLYTGEWNNAETEASSIIANNNLYALAGNLDSVFLPNSSETILQLQTPNGYPYATMEGNNLMASDPSSNPSYYLTDDLLSAFEANDLRKDHWVSVTQFQGTDYYFPYKYKVYVGFQNNITEYYTLFRLTEQYLIRAEARAHQNRLTEAITDLNAIRERAGLPDLSLSLSQQEVLDAVMQERRIELFAEWGHRWFDLKRTGRADTVLGPIKSTWNTNAKLYPIPASELVNDPNLTQNP